MRNFIVRWATNDAAEPIGAVPGEPASHNGCTAAPASGRSSSTAMVGPSAATRVDDSGSGAAEGSWCSIQRRWRSVGEPPPAAASAPAGPFDMPAVSRRRCMSGTACNQLLCVAVLLAVLMAQPLSAAAGQVLATAPTAGPDANQLAYETSDSDELIPRLSTFFPPGTVLGDNGGFRLGVTRYRIVGADTQRNAVNGELSEEFITAVKQSFNQEYQTFNLLVAYDNVTLSQAVPVRTVNTSSAAGVAAAQAAQASKGQFVTDPFNQYAQYVSVDVDVSALCGSDLAARLPASWLPMAKNTPQFENAMRQRGYLVTALTLEANVSEYSAINVFPRLPIYNSTAVEMDLQLSGEDIVPLDLSKQTLLMVLVQQLLPRLFNGIGPRWARITSVRQSYRAKTANVTMLMATSSTFQYFEQALVTALADLPASLAIAGLPANVSITRMTPVPGYTLTYQVNQLNNVSTPAPEPNTVVYTPVTKPRYNVSSLEWENGTLPEGQQVTIGTVFQRIVGQVTVQTDSNLTAEIANAYRIMNLAKPWNYTLSLGHFVPSLSAPSESVPGLAPAPAPSPAGGNRKLLQVSITNIASEYQFNAYNDFASLDFQVTFNATRYTQLPSALLPLALPLNLVQGVLKARGYLVTILTLDAILDPSSAPLLEQIPPTNTTAVQTAFQLQPGVGLQGTPIVPFTVPIQTAVLTLFRSVLPPLSNGLGPRWVRIADFSAGPTEADGVNVTMLMYRSVTPLDEFLTLLDGALNELPQLLQLSGLPVTLMETYSRPVTGYTLEAQLRDTLGLPPITYPEPVGSGLESPPLPPPAVGGIAGGSGSSSNGSGGGGKGLSGGAIAGIAVGAAALALVALVAGCLLVSRGRARDRAAARAAVLARDSGDVSFDSKRASRRPDDSAEQLYRDGTNGSSGNGSMLFPGASRNSSPHGTFSLPRSSLTKQAIGQLDAAVQGWDINADNIEICRDAHGEPWLLGEGSYGRVYRGLRGGVQDVAVKVLHAADDTQTRAFRKEISILKSISYDRNIVQFYGAVLTDQPMLVLEYMEGGDLRAALNDDPGGELRWYRRGQSIALDIARGLHFLHTHDVMHSDMKARNVLLSKGRETAKISDVGVARYLNECATATQSNYVAWTFAYAAPEILLNQKVGAPADVYSFGVMLWEIVTGIAPVRGGLSDLNVPEDCPAAIADLIQACLSVNPEQRPSAKQCFQVIRASNSGSDVEVPTLSPAHLSSDSTASLSTLAEPITERNDSVGSALPSDSASRRPSMASSEGGGYDASARRTSVRSDRSEGSRLRHSTGV